MRKYDLTGQKIGNWTVLYYIGIAGKSRDAIYQCKCDCGLEKPVKGYHIKNGYSSKCVNCSAEQSKIYGRKIPRSYWESIKRNAAKRNIEFNLTIDQVYDLFELQKRKCALSGKDIDFAKTETEHLKRKATASIDRIDPTKGYTLDNIQLVHKSVNFMKHTMQNQDFIDMCHSISTCCKQILLDSSQS